VSEQEEPKAEIEPGPWPDKGAVYDLIVATSSKGQTFIMEAPEAIWAYLEEYEGPHTEIMNLPLDYKAAVWRIQVAYRFQVYETPDGPEPEDWLEFVSGTNLYVAGIDIVLMKRV
jgi:hypothetical protein